ncbi:MAG: putative ATPase [Chlamydiales bacterium]|jgi:putative ATPase
MQESMFGEPEEQPIDPIEEADASAPLANRMRPRSLEEYVGQQHLTGDGKVLARLLEGELTQSLILWGPPGVGKTTLARLIAARNTLRFIPYSAVLSGIREIREVMAAASEYRERTQQRTLLFVDEIHRFNKAQQDAFLPFVERGDVLLIGATTENPSFEVIGPLLSRVRVFILEPLAVEDVVSLLRRAVEHERGLAGRLELDDGQLEVLARGSDGDARRALGLLETLASLCPAGGRVEADDLAQALQRKILFYDKNGEEHFNLTSALHKSIRNSDVDATLYWLARMLAAGEDGNYVARRLIRIASEDVGLGDTRLVRVTLDAADVFHRLGNPEGKLALAQAAVLLARAPKDNSVYKAFAAAEADVEKTSQEPVPLHLRNASTALMKSAGYGKGYRYVHDDPAAREEMSCMPPSLKGTKYI